MVAGGVELQIAHIVWQMLWISFNFFKPAVILAYFSMRKREEGGESFSRGPPPHTHTRRAAMDMNYGFVLVGPDKFPTLRFIFVVLKLNVITEEDTHTI